MAWIFFYWSSPDPLRQAQTQRLQHQVWVRDPAALFVVNPSEDDLSRLYFDRAWVSVGSEAADALDDFLAQFTPGDLRISLLIQNAQQRGLIPAAWRAQEAHIWAGQETLARLFETLPPLPAAPKVTPKGASKAAARSARPADKPKTQQFNLRPEYLGVIAAVAVVAGVMATRGSESPPPVAAVLPTPAQAPTLPKPPPPEKLLVSDPPVKVNNPTLKWVYSEAAQRTFTRNKITADEYRRCVQAGSCKPEDYTYLPNCNAGDPARADHPLNCVTFEQARTFCRVQGGRLPLYEELEAEATQNRRQPYPWGDKKPSCLYTVIKDASGPGCGKGTTTPTCRRPLGDSPAGLCDLWGNLMEWTADAGLFGRSFYWDGTHDNYLKSVKENLVEVQRASLNSLLGASPTGDLLMAVPVDIVGFRCVREGQP